MLTISSAQLFDLLQCAQDDTTPYDEFEDPKFTSEQLDFYRQHRQHIREIVCDSSMSELHIGGDDVIDIVDRVVEAKRQNLAVHTWYGPDAETLVVAFPPGLLAVE